MINSIVSTLEGDVGAGANPPQFTPLVDEEPAA